MESDVKTPDEAYISMQGWDWWASGHPEPRLCASSPCTWEAGAQCVLVKLTMATVYWPFPDIYKVVHSLQSTV